MTLSGYLPSESVTLTCHDQAGEVYSTTVTVDGNGELFIADFCRADQEGILFVTDDQGTRSNTA